ncbi:MAG: rhomboid family intramembrane serine protease [Solirubrobacterales bacterium]
MSETELSVVCKNCGSEVSPYVTECPYCGARLRKRAPKLERRGDALEAKPSRRRRRRRPRVGRSAGDALVSARPYATLSVILGSAVLVLVQRASDQPLSDFGAIAGPVGDEWWRYFAAPFAYLDIGYLFVIAIAVAIFAPGLERRLGSAPTLLLMIACGALGMLAADGIETAVGNIPLAAGGNGLALGTLAAWFVLRRAEARGAIDEEYDVVGIAVAAAVLVALPIFEDTANVYAGLAGGAVGAVAGIAAAALRPGD